MKNSPTLAALFMCFLPLPALAQDAGQMGRAPSGLRQGIGIQAAPASRWSVSGGGFSLATSRDLRGECAGLGAMDDFAIACSQGYAMAKTGRYTGSKGVTSLMDGLTRIDFSGTDRVGMGMNLPHLMNYLGVRPGYGGQNYSDIEMQGSQR